MRGHPRAGGVGESNKNALESGGRGVSAPAQDIWGGVGGTGG